MSGLETKVQIVTLAQFCERFDLRTPGGKLALRRGRRLIEKRFHYFRDGAEIWTTEHELARVILGPEAKRVLNEPGKHYGTGREGTLRAVMEILNDLVAIGAIEIRKHTHLHLETKRKAA